MLPCGVKTNGSPPRGRALGVCKGRSSLPVRTGLARPRSKNKR
nr:MAG TPA: hypothetical protein [Caudoviricetes sp.]